MATRLSAVGLLILTLMTDVEEALPKAGLRTTKLPPGIWAMGRPIEAVGAGRSRSLIL